MPLKSDEIYKFDARGFDLIFTNAKNVRNFALFPLVSRVCKNTPIELPDFYEPRTATLIFAQAVAAKISDSR